MRSILMVKPRSGLLSAWLILGLGFTLFFTSSCKHDGIPADQFQQVCFTRDVLPIFQNSCGTTGCHDGNGRDNGYTFTNYTSIMEAITPGNSSKSKAYQAITSTLQIMPPNNALPMDKRILIRLWIDQGATESACDTTTVTVPIVKSGTLWACYDRDIEPIFTNSCAVAGCHNAASHQEGIDMSSYTKAFANISPGNPAGSKIYKAITSSPGSEHFMPQKPYSALSKAAIDSIYSWIKRGGLKEECQLICDTIGSITYASQIKPFIDLTCVSCHGANSPSGGIKLLTSTDLQTVAKSGKLLAVLQRKGAIVMPPSYALDACQIKEIELWSNQGYN